MIDHHFMAVRMGEQCVANARHERLREQCAEIAKAQREEIRMMRSWLRRWYHTDHKPHLGMRERAQLRELASPKGAKYEIIVMEWLLRRLVLAEAIIAIVVLAVTALLGIALPPRAG